MTKMFISKGLQKLSKDEIKDLRVKSASLYAIEGLKNYIIPSGFNLNKIDEEGKTLMHYYAEYACKTHIKYLLENGADINIIDNYGKKPIDYIDINNKNLNPSRKSKIKAVHKLLSN